MHRAAAFACLLLGLAEASVATANIPIRRDVFTLPLEVAQRPRSIVEGDALLRREAGLSSVAPSSDYSSFYVVLSVGNIDFRVSLDTGSADLWLLSSKCTESTCHGLPSYPLSYDSPTFVAVDNNQTTFSLSFADGTQTTGFIALETVQLGNFSVPEQPFGLVTSTNVSLDDSVSGILGLGFSRLSEIASLATNSTPFLSTLAQQGNLTYPMFGISLSRSVSGTLALGAIDGSVVKNASNIAWSEVVPFAPFSEDDADKTPSYLQWAIHLTNIFVNGTEVKPVPTYPQFTQGSSVALLDVGTNGIFGPWGDVAKIFSHMDQSRLIDEENGLWALPCGTNETMSFNFGGQNFTLQPTDYLFGSIEDEEGACLAWPRASFPSSDGIDWQLGTPFLRTVYSVFSYGIDTKEPPMIGLYPLSNISTPDKSASAISAILASYDPTLAATLPNSIVPTPSGTALSLPSYIFASSLAASATPGLIVSSALGASAYSPLFFGADRKATGAVNASAIPTVLPAPSVVTVTETESGGAVVTVTSTATTIPTGDLGKPPGERASGGARRAYASSGTSAWTLMLLPISVSWFMLCVLR